MCTWRGTHEGVTLYTHSCLWKWPHQKIHPLIRRCHPHARKSASHVVQDAAQPSCESPNTSWRFALGASNFCPVKTRRIPSRHRRDVRVYDHTTTAMHDMSTPPAPPHLNYCPTPSLTLAARCLPQSRGRIKPWVAICWHPSLSHLRLCQAQKRREKKKRAKKITGMSG